MTDRRSVLAAALATGLAPAFLRTLPAAEPRFGLGVASGQPRPDGMVLWTRLTGAGLPERVTVGWEIAYDERFEKIAARGEETAEQAFAHSVHAEPGALDPGRWYWYRFRALGDESPIGRTRTAPAPDAAASLDLVLASCQRWDVGHYAAWRHVAGESIDAVLFVGDYIYESGSPDNALRRHDGGAIRDLAGYRQRYAQYKSDPALQAAHARAPWLVVWDDHEVDNDYAGLQGQSLQPDFRALRAAAYQAWWEHMPVPKAARPIGPDMRIYGRLDWGRLARIHLLDDRQYRDPQACPKPGRGGSATVRLAECPALLDAKRTLLGFEQERWLADGWDGTRPWNLVAQQTLMARFAWETNGPRRMAWTDGWDGYEASRRRLLAGVAERKLPGAVVLGGDVHAHYVADLKADFDDERAPVVASEICGTSITSLGLAQERIDAALRINPHVKLGRGDRRGFVRLGLVAKRLDVDLRVLADAADPVSTLTSLARFVVEADRPGPQPA